MDTARRQSAAAISGFDEYVSPELCLIDPELRSRLLGRATDLRPARAHAATRDPAESAARDESHASTHALTLSPRTVGIVLLAAIAAAFALGLPGGSTRRPAPPAAGRSSGEAARPQRLRGVRVLAWAPAVGATSYEVELFAGDSRVLSARTRDPRLALTVALRGGASTIKPGTYEWYVWPIRGNDPAEAAMIRSRLVLPAPSA
jgi:hypothetical protein